MPRFSRGMSLIDVIVGVGLLLVVFMTLFGILRASLLVSSLARAKAGATAVAATQLEYLRGISYESLGTVGGIPSGTVPEYATTTQNGIDYVAHTFIQFVDDTADGLGASDTNDIPTDYKRARVSVSYTIGSTARVVTAVSNFAPKGIESTAGGGTLSVAVVNALGSAVDGATVRVQNPSLIPSVDLTTFSNIDGSVLLPGAAASSDYRIIVSRSGYSSAQTYARDTTNQSPNPGHLTIAEGQTTTGTFAIDLLSSLSLFTYSPIATSTFSDSFADDSLLAVTASTTVSGGTLTLGAGETSGFARSVATTPPLLVRWGEATADLSLPEGATALLRLYDGGGSLLPDEVLPGNTAGFAGVPIHLYGISTTTYPSLSLAASLTGTAEAPPSIAAWSISFTSGPHPLPNVPYALTGAKTIGTTGGGAPIYKTSISSATDENATETRSLEWDTYSVQFPEHDLVDACPTPPLVLAPGASSNASFILDDLTTHSLRVVVTDSTGVPVPEAGVTVSRTGFSAYAESSSCGNAYFGGIASDSYTVTIEKTGYTTTAFPSVPVSGASVYGATFP